MKFFLRFKIYEFAEEHGYTVLHTLPYHCHFNHTELVCPQTNTYYNRNIRRNWFGMEAMKRGGGNCWKMFVCLFFCVDYNAKSVDIVVQIFFANFQVTPINYDMTVYRTACERKRK
jgi:hypothetical protein